MKTSCYLHPYGKSLLNLTRLPLKIVKHGLNLNLTRLTQNTLEHLGVNYYSIEGPQWSLR